MTAQELMADLRRRGIRLVAAGDQLRFHPRDAVGLDLLASLREHKAEIMTMLGAEFWAEARQVFDRKAWYPVAEQGPAAQRPEGSCPRCGALERTDVPIHEGRSIRRDCGKCGRFVAFVRWYDVEQFPAAERN